MKKIILIFICYILFFKGVMAESFFDALSKAFKNNSELNAERENIKIFEEEYKISQSSYLPTISLEGTKSKEDTNKLTNRSGADVEINDIDPTTTSISISQTLIDFSRKAELDKSTVKLEIAKAKLLKKEQEILYKSIDAYASLITALEKLKINKSNVDLLNRQAETDRIRFERGQISLSDVSQSESSFAGAQAQYIQAENDFITNKLNYENIIGSIKDVNSLNKKTITDFILPKNLIDAIEISKKNNPDLIIARLEYDNALNEKLIARSGFKPTAKISLERSYTEDLSTIYDEREKDTLKATLSWPFYSGGKNWAQLRKSESLRNKTKLTLDSVSKQNQTKVASAWSSYQSNKSLLNAVKLQLKSAEIANEGIKAEYNSGSSGRTTMEVIQSNSLLLDAQLSLANSERNFILSKFNLLRSVGLLSSKHLKIR